MAADDDVARLIDDPTCHGCLIAQSVRAERDALRVTVARLRSERADLLAVIARHQGLARMPGAVATAHPDTTT